MMRIITGSARGTKLLAPEGLHTRPTSERAKQGVYNILQFEISDRRVLDLFAGSGQMGLEALSRGAKDAVFCDTDTEAIKIIKQNIQKTHMEARATVLQGDYKSTLRALEGKGKFGLIFLDPPYRSDYAQSALTLLKKYHLIERDAYIVIESDSYPDIDLDGWMIHKTASWGKNHVMILKRAENDAAERTEI